MSRFAKGTYALARCPRCGDKVKYLDMMQDGDNPGLRVCPSCYDIAHPAEKPVKTDDASILRKPSPDVDNDGTVDTTLTAAMGWDRMFGGPA